MPDVRKVFESLRDYYISYYNTPFELRDRRLATERTRLMLQDGVIAREPLVELIPRYVSSEKTISEAASDLKLGSDFAELIGCGLLESGQQLYRHQYEALEQAAVRERSFVVTAGTGSGKTETFLLPILWRLINESAGWPAPGEQPTPWWDRSGPWTPLRAYENRDAAIRCIVLYPMNALVEDQLRRLRIALDSDPVRSWLDSNRRGNRIYFGRYTGRTPGSGAPPLYGPSMTAAVDRHQQELQRIRRGGINAQRADEREAAERGRPLRDDEMRRYFNQRTDGAEMISRWDMIAHPPDVFITNYSMLNVMLMRDREDALFRRTRDWLHGDPSRVLTLVIDELHMYRGTAGSEVALLLRSLRRRLGLTDSSKLRVYAASASLSGDTKGLEYARQFLGLPELEADDFLAGEIADPAPVPSGAPPLAAAPFRAFETAWRSVNDTDHQVAAAKQVEAAKQLATDLGVEAPTKDVPALAIGEVVENSSLAGRLVAAFPERRALPVRRIAKALFPDADKSEEACEEASEATYGVLLTLHEGRRPDGAAALPLRVHLFFRNVRGAWACSNPSCDQVEAGDGADPRGIGRIFLDAQLRCDCGARVLELLYCEDCGEALLGGYTSQPPPITAAGTYVLPEAPNLEALPDYPVTGRTSDRYVVYWPSASAPGLEPNAQKRYTWKVGDYQFTLRRAVLDPQAGHICLADADMHPTGWVVEVQHDPDVETVAAFPTRCPACGEHAELPARVGSGQSARSLSAKERVRSCIRTMGTGFAKVSQVVSDTLLRELRADRLGDLTARDPRLVVFSDSRQDSAKLSTGLEVSHYQDLVRELLIKRLEVRQSELRAFLDYHDRGESSDAATRWEDAHPQEALAFMRVQSGRASDADRAIVERVRASVSAPIPLSDLYGAIEQQLLALGVNPAGPGIDNQAEPDPKPLQRYPESTRAKPWTNLFEFAYAPPAERQSLEGEQIRLRDRIRRYLREQIGVTLFTSRGRDLESLGLGWVSVARDGFDINAYADGLDPKVLQEAVDGSIRILGMKQRLVGGRYYKASQDQMPAYLRKYLEQVAEHCGQSADKLKKAVEDTLHASAMPEGWKLSIDKLAVQFSAADADTWECEGCGRLHLHAAGQTCTGVSCRKQLRRATAAGPLGIHEQDYFALLATSPIPPFRLHCEELTGQTDLKDSLARQQHFQDIFEDQEISLVEAVDLLSVTTTMEAGVDIGSLQAVMMANMPPRRFNYQQRVGRAGRRGDPLAVALTVCRGRTHDDFYFNNPERITGDPPPPPYIDLTRVEILRRAAAAEALRLAFRARFEALGQPPSDNDDDIYKIGRSTHGQLGPVDQWRGHRAWIVQWLADQRAEVERVVLDLLLWDDDDDRRIRVSPRELCDECNTVVEEIVVDDGDATRLATRIDRAVDSLPRFHTELSELLANRGILPMFGFPTRSRLLFQERPTRWPITENVVDRDLDIAIGQFAPGSETVKDKAVYTSIGIVAYEPGGASGLSEISDPFAGEEAIGICQGCQALSVEAESGDPEHCPVCGAASPDFQRTTIFQPPGFRTDYGPPRAFDGEFERNARVARARLAESAGDSDTRTPEIVKGLVVRSFYDNVYSINDNNGDGYQFVRYDRLDGYLVPDRTPDHLKRRAVLDERCRSLASVSNTNVLLLALNEETVPSGLSLLPTRLAARAAWYSFAFLIRAAATESLDVDNNELKVGMRTVRGASGMPAAEVFISDSLENGAGYAAHLAQRAVMEDLLDRISPAASGRSARSTFYDRWTGHTISDQLCDSSCHDCLRDYSNMPYHGLLDWRLALDMADLAAGRAIAEQRWLERAPAIQESLALAFGWAKADFGSAAFGVVKAVICEKTAYLLTHPLWDTGDFAPRSYAMAKAEAEGQGYAVQPVGLFDAVRRPGHVGEVN